MGTCFNRFINDSRRLMIFRQPILGYFFVSLLFTSCDRSPVVWWKGLNEKVVRWTKAEIEYEALRVKHTELEQKYLRLEKDYNSLITEHSTKFGVTGRLEATGSPLGVSPGELKYQVPSSLSYEDLLALAQGHLKEKRFREAAACFEVLFSQPEYAALLEPWAYYSSGVAWFELNNFVKARESFELAKANAKGESKSTIWKKADLWFRIIDQKIARMKPAEKKEDQEELQALPDSVKHTRQPASSGFDAHQGSGGPDSHKPATHHGAHEEGSMEKVSSKQELSGSLHGGHE